MAQISYIKTLKIVLHNVQAWTTQRKNELCNYYNRLDADILLLNSTGIINAEKIKIYNYNVYHRNIYEERHAGIAIAIKKNIKHKILDDYNDDILAVRINTNRGETTIGTLYSPPRRNYLPVGDMRRLFQTNHPTYLFADLNANHQMLGYTHANYKGTVIMDMINRGLATHMGPEFNTLVNRRGRPDILLCNRHHNLNTAIIEGDITSSDHIPIVIKLATVPILKESKKIKDYKNVDWEEFKIKIENKIIRQKEEIPLDGERVDREKIDIAIKTWTDDIVETMDELIPLKMAYKFIKPPDSDLIKILEMSYETLRDKNHWTLDDRRTIQQIQQMIRDESTRISNEQWSNEINKLQDIYGDPSKFWKGVRKMMGDNKNMTPYIINRQGDKIYEDADKEQTFRDIWTDIFRITDEENRNFDMTNDRRVNEYIRQNEYRVTPFTHADLDRLDPDNYLTRPTTRREIKQIINDFKNRKAPGMSGISKFILINIPDVAVDRYADIINLSMSMGYFPILFKNGLIILIMKPNKDGKDPINYRPITLLEIPGKILERIINNRLQRFFEENELYNKNQYGFRAGMGTELALTKIYETVATNQKYKDHANVICRDVKKAFDKVWHNGLKYKITNTELPSIIVKIICSYLSERTAQIKIGNTIGPKFDIQSGVPQGGILSPTLYIMYTADIPPPGPNTTDVYFADDITQVVEELREDRIQLARKTEREINRINTFEKMWKINTNVSKFNIISISKSRPEPIVVDGRRLEHKNESIILGLKIKRTGTVQHITERIQKAKVQTNKLKRFANLKTETKIHLYKSLVRPLLEYPIVPIALASKTQLLNIQRIQNKNLKIATRNDERYENKTTQEIHEEFNIEAMNVRLYDRMIKLWNKVEAKDIAIYDRSMNMNRDDLRDHSWWPRTALKYIDETPNPIYV